MVASFVNQFSTLGAYPALALAVVSGAAVAVGMAETCRREPLPAAVSRGLLMVMSLLLGLGFILICWFHYRIYTDLPLELPPRVAAWINQQLGAMNAGAAYGLPLYRPAAPPRYAIPVWIEN